jgi:hypothetical protein
MAKTGAGVDATGRRTRDKVAKRGVDKDGGWMEKNDDWEPEYISGVTKPIHTWAIIDIPKCK